MNSKQVAVIAVAALSMGMAVAPTASAGPTAMRVIATGVWAANVPTTRYSAPNEAFTFSFSVDSAFSFADYGTVKVIDPTHVHSFKYTLGGLTVHTSTASAPPPNCVGSAGTLCGVEMISSAGGGGLNLDFADYSLNFFSTNSADIVSHGKFDHGTFSFTPNVNGDPSPKNHQINEGNGPTTISVVPEPAAWAMMMIGLGFTGAALRSKRRGANAVI